LTPDITHRPSKHGATLEMLTSFAVARPYPRLGQPKLPRLGGTESRQGHSRARHASPRQIALTGQALVHEPHCQTRYPSLCWQRSPKALTLAADEARWIMG